MGKQDRFTDEFKRRTEAAKIGAASSLRRA